MCPHEGGTVRDAARVDHPAVDEPSLARPIVPLECLPRRIGALLDMRDTVAELRLRHPFGKGVALQLSVRVSADETELYLHRRISMRLTEAGSRLERSHRLIALTTGIDNYPAMLQMFARDDTEPLETKIPVYPAMGIVNETAVTQHQMWLLPSP
jgi:hypothetical protein